MRRGSSRCRPSISRIDARRERRAARKKEPRQPPRKPHPRMRIKPPARQSRGSLSTASRGSAQGEGDRREKRCSSRQEPTHHSKDPTSIQGMASRQAGKEVKQPSTPRTTCKDGMRGRHARKLSAAQRKPSKHQDDIRVPQNVVFHPEDQAVIGRERQAREKVRLSKGNPATTKKTFSSSHNQYSKTRKSSLSSIPRRRSSSTSGGGGNHYSKGTQPTTNNTPPPHANRSSRQEVEQFVVVHAEDQVVVDSDGAGGALVGEEQRVLRGERKG